MNNLRIKMSLIQTQVSRNIKKKTRELGLLPGQPKVLEYLAEDDGCSQNAISAAWNLDKSTVSGLLDRMVRDGLVHIEREGQDRRRRKVWMTETGRQKWELIKTYLNDLEQQEYKGISEEEKEVFETVLNKIYQNLKEGD